MIPMVESADQARRIVDYARYAPAGSRGVAVYHADDIEPEGLPATLAKANREIVLMPQIETVAGVEHVEEIAAVDGVDLLWIGHFDLTTSLGTPGAFWNEAHTAAVERVFAAAAAAASRSGRSRTTCRCPAAAGDGLPRDPARRCSAIRSALTSAFAERQRCAYHWSLPMRLRSRWAVHPPGPSCRPRLFLGLFARR